MAELDVSKTSVTDFNTVTKFTPEGYETPAQALDYQENGEVYVDYPNASKYYGYYKKYGQLKKAIDSMWIDVVGKGFETTPYFNTMMSLWKGYGEDSVHSIFWNQGVVSMIQGDSFAEIIRETPGKLGSPIINLKPISPERMRVVFGENGMIKRYEQLKEGKPFKRFKVDDIFHMSNDRIGDEQRGESVVETCEWVINAIDEARRDYRILLHRNIVPVRIIEIDTDDKERRDAMMAEYKTAIQKGEVLVIPKGTVDIKQDTISIQDPIAWIQSLENYFYLAVGIPKVIASPEGLSEGSSKVGYLIFEPLYTYRQTLMEEDIDKQLQIKLTFHRPPSLKQNMSENEAKNTSQLGIQPKDTTATLTRE